MLALDLAEAVPVIVLLRFAVGADGARIGVIATRCFLCALHVGIPLGGTAAFVVVLTEERVFDVGLPGRAGSFAQGGTFLSGVHATERDRAENRSAEETVSIAHATLSTDRSQTIHSQLFGAQRGSWVHEPNN
jgi:hypothetical protein